MKYFYIFLFSFIASNVFAQKTLEAELIIFGGGASGTTAAIEAARNGVKTILIEETDWLGGMLTAAGVSAIDGNHNLKSGLWAEFREKLYTYYGGANKVETGWVSNTLFEPSVGNKLLKEMAQLPNLQILYQTEWKTIKRIGDKWEISVVQRNKTVFFKAKLIIDATETGDVLAYLKIPYHLGMDSKLTTKERFAPDVANNIVQDITYVVTLKDYGKGTNKTIPKPAGYDPKVFSCACNIADPSVDSKAVLNDCAKMLTYGKLPNDKYMINWPKCGNDIYLNIVELSKKDRQAALKEAKLHSLRFIYYIQTVLGYPNLSLAEDEYPTMDQLPMIPYHRESRRIEGMVNLTVNDLIDPYINSTLYRTGIAVGDYPIDHHHLKNLDAPKIDFIQIKVPSYSIPLGSLIPRNTEGIIIAEKSIAVSNIVAGTTRLQSVVLLIGQAAGALAATAISQQVDPSKVNIRLVQKELLAANAYLLPYIDVKPTDKYFKEIQKIGATGILKGTGLPYKWANQTWFYPQMPISEIELTKGFKSFYINLIDLQPSGKLVDVEFFAKLCSSLTSVKVTTTQIENYLSQNYPKQEATLTRASLAVLINHFLNPFDQKIDFKGELVHQ